MNILKNAFTIIALSSFTFVYSCSQKEKDPQKIIAGENSKKWKAEKETNAVGEKEKLDKEEMKEIMEFRSNGDFFLDGTTDNTKGKWKYDNASKNLSLQFAGANVTENFAVLDLKEDEIKLQAADGSTMVLDAE